MQPRMHARLASIPSALLGCMLQQLPVHPRQWSIVATACRELSQVVASGRHRTAELFCHEHNLQTIHQTGKLLLKLTQDGDTAEALRLMVAGAPVDYQSKLGRTALHQASFRGNVELADALTRVGAQLDLQDLAGKTALVHATMRDHTQIAVALIGTGAQLDLQDNAGSTALLYAIALDHTEIALALIDARAQQDLWDVSYNMRRMLEERRAYM